MFRLPQNGRLPLCNVGDIAMGMNDASQNVALASTRGRMISGCKGACMPIWWIFNNIVALHTGFFSWWISIHACRCYAYLREVCRQELLLAVVPEVPREFSREAVVATEPGDVPGEGASPRTDKRPKCREARGRVSY